MPKHNSMKEKRQTIVSILKRIERVEQELSEIRKDIAECLTPTTASADGAEETELEFTMDDFCEAFGRKHKSYAERLRYELAEHGVTTLSQFLAMTPGQLLDMDGIGPGTLKYISKAMKKLGIRW